MTTSASTDVTTSTAPAGGTAAPPSSGADAKPPATDTPTVGTGATAPTEAKTASTDGKTDSKVPAAELEIKLPEGVVADAATLDEFKALAKESGLTGDVAQKVADLHFKAMQSSEKKVQAGWNEQVESWKKANRNDSEFGGAKYDESLLAIKKTMEKFDDTGKLRQFLEKSGLGEYPDFVRFVHRIAKASADDSVRGTTTRTDQPKRNANAIEYPSMANQA